jgi:exopolyphosphatase / guanosine-5'-triphosphate,3'-diphosphate pyrophosphatase
MKVLAAADRERVRRASILLRLARALNLGRSGAVRDVHLRLRDMEAQFTIIPKRSTGVDLELWAIEKEKDYFRELFARTLSAAAA